MTSLSYAQHRLWFLDQAQEPSGAYNVPIALRLSGTLRTRALHEALCDVVTRHEPLRSVYSQRDAKPFRIVLDPKDSAPPLPVVEVTEADLAAALAAEQARPFDLSTELPLRGRLFRLGDAEHVLLLVIHHIATDAWSDQPLLRDLSAAYSRRFRGSGPEFDPLPVDYTDYVAWHRELLGDPEDTASLMARQLAFWQEALAGAPEELELPQDRPRSTTPGHHPAGTVRFRVGEDTHAALRAVAQSASASTFMAAQAALVGLLSRLGAGEDIVLGTVVNGRSDEALEDLVGFFVNTLALRTDTSGDPAFTELVQRVRATNLRAFGNQDVTFDQVVEAVNPPRAASRHPLFQVMFAWQEREEAEQSVRLHGLRAEPVPVGGAVAKFDLAVGFTELIGAAGACGLEGAIEYDETLFDRETVEELAARLVRLLDAVAMDPGLRLSGVELLDPREHELVMHAWQGAEKELTVEDLPEMFVDQVRRTPEVAAVEAVDARWTYAELNREANRIAHLLMAEGLGPESRVAVVAPRSAVLIATMLGVFKAGAVYLPIDPDYPADRIQYIIGDAEPTLILTVQAFAENFSGRRTLTLIFRKGPRRLC